MKPNLQALYSLSGTEEENDKVVQAFCDELWNECSSRILVISNLIDLVEVLDSKTYQAAKDSFMGLTHLMRVAQDAYMAYLGKLPNRTFKRLDDLEKKVFELHGNAAKKMGWLLGVVQETDMTINLKVVRYRVLKRQDSGELAEPNQVA